MVQRCCVPFCETKVGDADVNGVKVRFHRMPIVPERFQQWRSNITNHHQFKPEPELTVNSRICSKHFMKQDYIDNFQKPVTGNHILTKEAVPSRFRWSAGNCDVSAAIPFVRRIKPPPQQQQQQDHHNHHQQPPQRQQSRQHASPDFPMSHPHHHRNDIICIAHSAFEKQTQCSLDDERLKNEISRKNSIIQQLLERISQLETEHKTTTQLLLKESISGSAATSVIRSTSPLYTREHTSADNRSTRDHQQNYAQANNRNTSVIYSNHNSTSGSSILKRKLQQEDDDENIHYVLLSLSEKVVRHDAGSPTNAT